jgi:hypothetical protein
MTAGLTDKYWWKIISLIISSFDCIHRCVERQNIRINQQFTNLAINNLINLTTQDLVDKLPYLTL